MTSITNKSAHSAVSASLKSADMSVIKNHSNMNESDLQAETIEIIPELPTFNDSEDDQFSEYEDDDETSAAIERRNPFNLNMMDDDDDEAEPFDEYAYQVMSNHNEPQTIWFDNSQLKSLPMNSSIGDYSRSSNSSNNSSSDVILIDDDNSDDEFNENSNGGLTHEPSNGSTEQKMYSCNICHSKLSSSYNLKRHMMIHTGEKPFECEICKRRFREQSDLRKHKKVHNNDTQSKCSACNRYPPASRHSSKCIACEKQEAAAKLYQESLADDLVPRIDANNKKSFICKYCDRSFGSSSNLKRHIMIHTGEKPFTCSECSRPFREMSTLKKHLITHRRQNGFNSGSSNLKQNPIETGQQLMSTVPSSKPTQLTQSLHKCPLCKTICRGTENLMNHITTVHRPTSAKSNASSEIRVRKFSKSPPPLIPINKAVFKYLNSKRI